MGFTALDGLMMGTRCGRLDPGVLYLMAEYGMTIEQVEALLYNESGLLGVSGLSSDMRTLEASPDPDARAAIDLYVNRITCELGAMPASLGGLDALVFTGGVGQRSATIRKRVCAEAAWLGIELESTANCAQQARVSTSTSRTSAWSIPTDEEWMLVTHAQASLAMTDHSGTGASAAQRNTPPLTTPRNPDLRDRARASRTRRFASAFSMSHQFAGPEPAELNRPRSGKFVSKENIA